MSAVAFEQDTYPAPEVTAQDTTAFSSCYVARRQTPPVWLREVCAKLESLAALQADWDSYGAHAIDGRSIGEAIALASNLAMVESVAAPAVGGTPEGHVGFSWDGGLWSLDAEVLPTGRIEYIYLDERDSTEDREASTFNAYELLVFLTQWS